MEVEVPQNQMRIGKKRKQTLRWYGAIRGAIRMKEIYRGDPQGAVGESKETFRIKKIH